MALINTITGVEQVVANLRRRYDNIANGTAQGLKAAGLLLQRESQKLVPVDTGQLKSSAFTRSNGAGFETEVIVGYTAGHALFVHESVGMVLKGQKRIGGRGRYWDPKGRGQAKFLEQPFRTLAPEMRRIIKAFAKP